MAQRQQSSQARRVHHHHTCHHVRPQRRWPQPHLQPQIYIPGDAGLPGKWGDRRWRPSFVSSQKLLWHDRRSASHAGSCCRWQASSMEDTQPTSSMWSWMSRVASTWYHRALSAVTELVGLQTSAVGRRESQRRGFHRMICYHRPVRHPSPLEQLDQGSRCICSVLRPLQYSRGRRRERSGLIRKRSQSDQPGGVLDRGPRSTAQLRTLPSCGHVAGPPAHLGTPAGGRDRPQPALANPWR